jgi:hypothetical protein
MTLPEQDPAKRDEALAKARAARQLRAELKQMLKSGEVGIAEVIGRAGDVEALAKMRVFELVESMPAYGKVKARRLMEQMGIAPTRRLRGLGSNQRDALVGHFEARADSSGAP